MRKVCSKCEVEKDYDEFYVDNNPRNKTGRQSRCKDCARAVSKTAYHALSEEEYAGLLAYNRGVRHANPERTKAWDKKKDAKRRIEKPEQVRALGKARAEKYRERHPGRGLKGNAERLRRWRKKWPERELETQNGRRTIFKGTPKWGQRDMIRIVYKKAKELGFEVDHIVPIKHPLVCGLHVWHNLQLLSRADNRRKKNRTWPHMP